MNNVKDLRDAYCRFSTNQSTGGNCGFYQAAGFAFCGDTKEQAAQYTGYGQPVQTLREFVKKMRFPTLFTTDVGGNNANSQYVDAVVRICEEEEISHVVLPSTRNMNYGPGRNIGAVIVYPRIVIFNQRNLAYKQHDPEGDNVAYCNLYDNRVRE